MRDASTGEWFLSQRDSTIVARHEVPGIISIKAPSQRTIEPIDRPFGTGRFLQRYPGTPCLATICLSLRDKSHSPIEAPRNLSYLSAYEVTLGYSQSLCEKDISISQLDDRRELVS
jgi:hypothetical protein